MRTGHYDFKGNLLTSARRFARDFAAPLDWSGPVAMEDEQFDSASAYDALNRAIAITTPDGSVYRPTFNDASLLERVEVNVRGAARQGERIWTCFVDFINYDARGQRTMLCYANGARTTYHYDTTTFRLIRLKTTRPQHEDREAARIFCDPQLVQDLHYIYDTVGNITHIEDRALRTVFHAGRRVDVASDFTCDPLYRLLNASGRENKGQSSLSFAPPDGNYRDFPFVGATSRHDLEALQRYVERYDYDPLGNIQCMEHRAEGGGWTRNYHYEDPSQLQPKRVNNRLSRTATGNGLATFIERYRHDVHGNMIEMPHLPVKAWDFRDRFRACSRQVAECGERAITLYVYDGSGKRVSKVTLRPDGRRQHERFYVGGFEIYREYEAADKVQLERQTLHVIDGEERIALVETLTVERGSVIQAPVSLQCVQLANHLGSSTLELDDAARLISYEEYSPYGCTTFQTGRSAAEVRRKRYRYTDKERDSESGFTYHGARYYAPWLGRWVAADAKFKPGHSNGYEYVGSNPIVLHDPTGQDGAKRFWGGMRALGGAAQALGGLAFAIGTAETVAGAVGGLAVAYHGYSDMEAGARQMMSGKDEDSIVEKGTPPAGKRRKQRQGFWLPRRRVR